MYQQVTLLGRVGRDAELRMTPTGQTVLSWSLAVDVGWGEQKRALWFRCSLWGERAPKLVDYVRKGQTLLVIGEMREPGVYQGRDGKWKASLEVTVQRLQFAGGGGELREAQPEGEQGPSSGPFGDEAIPF